jgi:FMN phosphatase YigB (HAD superfamily)
METFESLITGDINVFKERFDAFYDTGFLKVRGSVMENKWIKKSVERLKEKGYQLVLATNPLFPKKLSLLG